MNQVILLCWFIFVNNQATPTVYKDEVSCETAIQYVKGAQCVRAEFTIKTK